MYPKFFSNTYVLMLMKENFWPRPNNIRTIPINYKKVVTI